MGANISCSTERYRPRDELKTFTSVCEEYGSFCILPCSLCIFSCLVQEETRSSDLQLGTLLTFEL
ncbi:hypothetical protein MPTK1_6g01830 [Marchantia polymorpha subsp. ruderalis]|uniref:Uncharacterized protein n=2 Tax=Marchantia polymorpha TaxID=3197 RepID=A0AAF6BMJ3_MARPO|nr:hypothetical protein MARPO_0052s0021 [Marchantia polymorpha]BBN13227.1 hypothetical protein Mp_6g01830 [Marchantia polymorpha subsp. ruderalis]|eukprot:PTQ38218.1 hypothetical protein MARPO_0052s0021 [Marchantia polymorpha]